MFLLGLLLPCVAFAEFHVKLIANLKPQILDLRWDPSPDTQMPEIRVREKGQMGAPYFVKIKGHFGKKDSNLVYLDGALKLQADRSFELEVPIGCEKQAFNLYEVSANGNSLADKYELVFPEWGDFIKSQKTADRE